MSMKARYCPVCEHRTPQVRRKDMEYCGREIEKDGLMPDTPGDRHRGLWWLEDTWECLTCGCLVTTDTRPRTVVLIRTPIPADDPPLYNGSRTTWEVRPDATD